MLLAIDKVSVRTESGVLTAQTVADLDRLPALEAAWRALEDAGVGAVFFQSYDWCAYIWRVLRRVDVAGGWREPRVIVVRAAGTIVAIWPLAIASGVTGRYGQDLSEPFGQYSDILIAPGHDVDAVMAAAMAELGTWGLDGVIVRRVRADARFRSWVEQRGYSIGAAEAAPAAELGAFESHEAYQQALTAKTRKNLRNYRNRLGRLGILSHEVAATPEHCRRVIEDCFIGRTNWLQASGLTSTAFSDDAFSGVVGGLARGEAGAPRVIAMALSLRPNGDGGREVGLSLQWGFLHKRRYYAFMSARNGDYDAYSPGRLHLEDVVEACAGLSITTVDLLVPAMPYKLGVATASVGVDGFALPLSMRGRLYIGGWHGTLRPLMKSALLSLPAPARRWVVHPIGAVRGSFAGLTSWAARPR
jgi:CelD/BcsL family acetyltransferase involved in cellulose biosynthesis